MRIAIPLLVVAGVLAGCSSTKPPHNVGFAGARSLQDLNGTYLNQGESRARERNVPSQLSAIIWPKRVDVAHHMIHAIDVRAATRSRLAVRALGDSGEVLVEQTFVAGKDFEFRNGRLKLRGKDRYMNEPGAPGIFVELESRELGIDKAGQGKFMRGETILGAAYLVVPIMLHGTDEVRFVRISD